MKRDKRLYPLSWNHQNALALAHRIRVALKGRSSVDTGPWVDQLQGFWNRELLPHFSAEEEVLFPAVKAQGKDCDAEIRRTLQEHIQMAGLVQMMTQPDTGDNRPLLKQFAELLTDHIRFEERRLFPRIEKFLFSEQLDEVGQELAVRLPVSPLK